MFASSLHTFHAYISAIVESARTDAAAASSSSAPVTRQRKPWANEGNGKVGGCCEVGGGEKAVLGEGGRHFILYERVLRLRTMLSIFNFIGTIPPIGKDSKVRRLLNSLVDIGLCILVLSQQYLNFFLGYCRCFCL